MVYLTMQPTMTKIPGELTKSATFAFVQQTVVTQAVARKLFKEQQK